MKPLDKLCLILIFIIGGLYGLTDKYVPSDLGTFLGTGSVILIFALILGWLLYQILKLISPIQNLMDKIKLRLSPTLFFGIIVSLTLFIRGLYDYLFI